MSAIANKTRWNEKFYMFKRFLEIHEAIINCNRMELSRPDAIPFHSEEDFRLDVETATKALNKIRFTQVNMQERLCTLPQCRKYLDGLLAVIAEDKLKNGDDSQFSLCNLGSSHIGDCAINTVPLTVCRDPTFETAVVKIQSAKERKVVITTLQRRERHQDAEQCKTHP